MAVVEFTPSPPTSIAPGVTVVTLGTASVLTEVVLTFVATAVSQTVAVSTPWKSVMPPFHFSAAERVNV